jgi:exosortase
VSSGIAVSVESVAKSQSNWIAWLGDRKVAAGFLLALVAVLYGRVLGAMAAQWWSDPNWEHGLLVPVVSGWVAWKTRRRWMAVASKPSWLGLAGVAFAMVLLVLGSLAAELFTTRFSFVLLLGSVVLLLGGWRRLRALAFPLGFLLLMIPWPAIIYAQTTLPLELLSSHWAALALRVAHVPVLREGNLLILPNYTLQVVVACSGIRSIVSLLTLAIAYGYLAEKRIWARLFLVAAMIPIAIVSNSFRIFGTGVLTADVSPDLAHGFFHEFSGFLIFLAATSLMLVVHAILRRIWPRKESLHD